MKLIFKGGFDPSIKEQCTNIQQLKEYKERITKEVEDNKQRILVQVHTFLNYSLIINKS